MNGCLKAFIAAALYLAGPLVASAQCGFAFEPASEVRWYRSEGWSIPGLNDAKAILPANLVVDGKPSSWSMPDGITFSMVWHENGYHVTFPEAIFIEENKRTKMLSRSFLLYQMVRWEINGKVYAYSYSLGPLDVACMAYIDIIDDKGDGVFRVMTPTGHNIMGKETVPLHFPSGLYHQNHKYFDINKPISYPANCFRTSGLRPAAPSASQRLPSRHGPGLRLRNSRWWELQRATRRGLARPCASSARVRRACDRLRSSPV